MKLFESIKKSRFPIVLLLFFICVLLLVTIISLIARGSNDDSFQKDIILADITSVEINIAESYPPQIILYIKGIIKDNCTEFYRAAGSQNGLEVDVTVGLMRDKKEGCESINSSFEHYLNLGSGFISGEIYDIKVNDYQLKYQMP